MAQRFSGPEIPKQVSDLGKKLSSDEATKTDKPLNPTFTMIQKIQKSYQARCIKSILSGISGSENDSLTL